MRKFRVSPILVALGAVASTACGAVDGGENVDSTEQFQLGDKLDGILAADFIEAKATFSAVEELDEGLGPIFNEAGCATCHSNGAVGGAGDQIERRFGRFVNGLFDPLANRGGSLRQLFTVGSFRGLAGQSCNVPLEVEPAEATVHNVGRLTTPLFGLGLVDAVPDSFFDSLAAAQPASVRGIVNRVRIVLPNPDDPSQRVGGTRVGRFGWKAGVPNLVQFAADAYVNEMGITTQSCINGQVINDFATESAPNGVAQPAGCDDLAPLQPAAFLAAGIRQGTDDAVGPCTGGRTEIQDDVAEFAEFMTFLRPPPRGNISQEVTRGDPVYNAIGCNTCHTRTQFTTPTPAPNGVPQNTKFQPFSDFLLHDMGTLGDQIGNAGDSVAVTRRMRTAPLWGIRFRHFLLHDGRTSDIATAMRAHDGQGAAARNAFNALNATDRSNLLAFVNSL
ncbi:MAG TPA: di-heme oxidoredictase family protein [Polyangiaceae bacterium]